MSTVKTSEKQARTTNSVVRALRPLFPLIGAVALLLALVPGAAAFKVISESGSGAGETKQPRGLAVDNETGRLFVADTGNNRVDVFDQNGDFERAFGWGVKNGANELQVCTTTCRAGIAGSGQGQFNRPTEIAVDNTGAPPHSVYVVDYGNGRIQKFDPEGNFILSFGAKGEAEGQFAAFAELSRKVLVSVGPSGVVYVIDSINPSPGVFNGRLQRFDSTGTAIAPQQALEPSNPFAPTSFGVNSNGDFYTGPPGIRKYTVGSDTPIAEISNPFEEPTGGVAALTVDPSDNIFVVQGGFLGSRVNVMEFSATGAPLRRFGYGSFAWFAQSVAAYGSPNGDIYASEPFSEAGRGDRVLHLDFPDPGPLVFPTVLAVGSTPERQACSVSNLGNSKATLNAEINPEGKSTTFHFEYISEADFIANGNSFSGPNAPGETEESDPIGLDFTMHEVSAAITPLAPEPLVPETEYRCRVVATNADGTIEGESGTFTTLEPLEIVDTSVSEVGSETVTLNAKVNPLEISASGYFEYVEEETYLNDIAELGPEHGFDHALKAPKVDGEEEEPLDFGAGEDPVAKAVTIFGLTPGIAYRFRIVATDVRIAPDPPPNEVFGPTMSFRTYASSEGTLPDGRAWELVSPAQKNSAEVAIPGGAGGIWADEKQIRIQVAADSGEAVTYTSWTSFGDGKGAQASSQYLSKRTTGGWGTENISPLGFISNPTIPPYRGFTPDLAFGAFVTTEPPLTEEAQKGTENLYLRDSSTGDVQALTVEEPQLSSEGFCAGYAGASADGKRAFFAANGAMAGAPAGKGFSLYEWSAAEGLKLISVLPDGTPAPLAPGAENGDPPGTGIGAVGSNCYMAQKVVANAISEDGKTVFWKFGGEYTNAKGELMKEPLFARMEGTETIQLDAKPASKAGSGPFGKGRFMAATPDGTRAFFTAPGKLTSGAAANSLYRYDTFTRQLTNLIPTGVAPESVDMAGISEDGAYAYFVAPGALTGEQEGPTGQKAVQGARNLYLWHEEEGLRFIVRLSELDDTVANGSPEKLTSRVTPDGRHFAFLSVASEELSGYDNTIVEGPSCQPVPFRNELYSEGDPRCPQAYLYDAEADELTCASCNPSGSRPLGPTQVPGWTNPYAGPRILSDDGTRLFFESRDVLSAADENERRDVYQYEVEGEGSCTEESPGFNPAADGCISLITSGKSEDESYFVDASADGRDVFFSTRGKLTGWDTNENYDVYDARIGGGFPEPSQTPVCEGEGCKPPLALPPISGSSPGTASFQGPGNAVQKTQKKKRKKRAKKRKAKGGKGKNKKRASHKRRAGR